MAKWTWETDDYSSKRKLLQIIGLSLLAVIAVAIAIYTLMVVPSK